MAKKVKEKKVPKKEPKKEKYPDPRSEVVVKGRVVLDFNFTAKVNDHESATKLSQDILGYMIHHHYIPNTRRVPKKRKERIQVELELHEDVEVEEVTAIGKPRCARCGYKDPCWVERDDVQTCSSFEHSSNANLGYPDGEFIHDKCLAKLSKLDRFNGQFAF